MAFVKADLKNEKEELDKLVADDVAYASGLSQQAVSRIETGSGATISSLIKYQTGTEGNLTENNARG